MRISIDASGLGISKTGTLVYLLEILSEWNKDKNLSHEYFIFINKKSYIHFIPLNLNSSFKIIYSPENKFIRGLWQQVIMPIIIIKLNIKTHWGTGFVLPLLLNIPMVLTIHDLTLFIFPKLHEFKKRIFFSILIRASIFRATKIIAISETTQNDLHRIFPISQRKTELTLLGVRNFIFSDEVLKINTIPMYQNNSYVLFIGTVEPRKNLIRLISAWKLLSPDIRNSMKLIIVGVLGWQTKNIIDQINSTNSVEYIGPVDDSNILKLLRNAAIFVYPSIYEGFGLPVLEAMSLGIPVITSNSSAMFEVAQNSALLVDPYSVNDIHDKLFSLLTNPDLRNKLSLSGKKRSESFTWQCTALKTLKILEKTD